MALWSTTLRIGKDLKLLVTSPERDDLIKARLSLQPRHPRALLTMLERIALYSGEQLCAVISAGALPDAWAMKARQICSQKDRASAARHRGPPAS